MQEILNKEKERLGFWIPVLFATGIGLYFLMPVEPSLWATLGVIELLIVLAIWKRFSPRVLAVLAIIAIVVLGFADIQLRSVYMAKYQRLEKPAKIYLQGKISARDFNSRGKPRLILEELEDFDGKKLPWSKVKVSLMSDDDLQPGTCVELVAQLMPLPTANIVGGFQFDRKSFFEGLSGNGYALSRALPLACEEVSRFEKLKFALDELRNKIIQRIDSVLPPEEAAVTAAIVAGERGGIKKQIMTNYRDSGLAHFLSISGLHMSMLAGLMFFFVRLLAAMIPTLSLRCDSKKPAAVLAIFLSLFYLLISGAAVPTQRAFIMTFIVLMGVIFARRAISMKTIAWAAMIVLIISPEVLIGPSFQMSFAAVVALIAFYEKFAGRLHRFLQEPEGANENNFLIKSVKILWIYVVGILVSDLIASLATLPFAIYHFNRIALYTSLANMLAGPIIGLVIMPFVLLALLLMPLGLDYWPLKIVGWGIGEVNAITDFVAHLPHAGFQIPAMPLWGLLLIVYGGLWLLLWNSKWRCWGWLGIVAGVLSLMRVNIPDVIVDKEGQLFAVKDNQGEMVVLPCRGNYFNKKMWLEKTANEKMTTVENKQLKKIYNGELEDRDWLDLSCGEEFCLYKKRVKIIKTGGLKVDGATVDLATGLGASVCLQREKAKILTVRDDIGYRLWNYKPKE